MAYVKTDWVDDSVPAINASNLNKIEAGIETATDIAEELRDNPVKASETQFGNMKCWVTGNATDGYVANFTTALG